MPSQRRVIGLIGCGRWGRSILRDLVSLGCEVPVVARSDASIARAHAGGASTVVPTADALPELDGAVVAVPTTGHAAAVRSVADRGIPIFVEKPLTADVDEARALVDTVGERLFVMDKWRYHPGVELLRDIAASDELGPVRRVVTVRDQWASPHDDVDTTWVHLPHDLAIVYEILGELPAVTSARAELVGDIVTGLSGELGGGAATISHAMTAPVWRREVRLVCEQGVAVLTDGYADHVVVQKGAPDRAVDPEHRPIASELPLLAELRAFVEHLEGGPPPRSSAAIGLLVVERVAELRRAAGLR